MNKSELANRFCNETYATKEQVQIAMKTPLIDGIWNSVLEYRNEFVQPLTLRHVNSTQYSLCLTPKISERIGKIERKMLKTMVNHSKIQRSGCDYYFKNISYIKILKSVAQRYGIQAEDTLIESIINGTLSMVPAQVMILQRYHNCLLEIERNCLQDISDNTLGEFYSLLMGDNDLTEYYRKKEIKNELSRYQIGKLYLGIPCNLIDQSIDQLITFINYFEISPFVKSVATFYYIYYVKPFEEYSEEIATLMAKKVLAYNDLDSLAAAINYESLLVDKEALEKVILESQKNYDLTYILDFFMKKAEDLLQELMDDIEISEKVSVQEDFYQPEPKPVIKEAPIEEPTEITKISLTNEELNENIGEEQVEIETPIIEPKPVETRVAPTQARYPTTENKVVFAQNIALNTVPTGLNEEEAKKLEDHLMELNPSLSHSQAYFYARHCTIGMSYTIAQYKKSVGCAYETARSNMDNLVELGYYRKDSLKNKFIYTPVKKN